MHKRDIMISMGRFRNFLRKIISGVFGKKSDKELGASVRSEYSTYDNSIDDPRRVRPYKSSHLAQELNRSASINYRKSHQNIDGDEDDDENDDAYGLNRKHYSGINDHLHYAMEQNRIPIHSNRTPEVGYSKRNPKQYSGINDHRRALEEHEKAVLSRGANPAELRERARKEVEKAHQPPKSDYKTVRERMMESFRDFSDDEK